MRRFTVTLAATAMALASLATIAPSAVAGDTSTSPDLSGRWNSAILRMDGVGWSMRLTPVAGSPASYDAILRFNYQDGRTGLRTRATVTVAGEKVTVRISDGRALKGSIGQDGSLFLPRCYEVLKFSTKADADETCLFQDLPRQS